MPHVCARLPPELHVAIVDARRDRKTEAEIEAEHGVHPSTIRKWSAHVAKGKRALVVESILDRLEQGDSLDTIASLENCALSFVARVVRARYAELEARARLEADAEKAKDPKAEAAEPSPIDARHRAEH